MRRLMSVLMCVAATGLMACGDGGKKSPTEPKEDTTPTPKTDIKSPEDARRELGELNIEYSREAFIKAVENEDVLAVALFIDAGMDPNTKNDRGEPVLLWAFKNGKSSVVDVFLKRKVGLNAQDRNEETALMWAVQASRPDVVERLIEAGADLNLRDEDGRTALTYAVAASDTVGLKLLLEAKADANADSGRAFVEAVRRSNVGLAKTLLAAGADVNVGGGWALTAAVRLRDESARSEMVKLLLEAGANTDVRVDDGMTALVEAVSAGHTTTAQQLLSAGADTEIPDDRGRTPLTIAVDKNNADMIALLLEAGANVDASHGVGVTALTLAADRGNEEIVRLLISLGADVNAQATSGSTALHFAVAKGHLEVVQLLVEVGADINVRNTSGLTSIMLAAASGQEEIVKFLLAAGAQILAQELASVVPNDLQRALTRRDEVLYKSLIDDRFFFIETDCQNDVIFANGKKAELAIVVGAAGLFESYRTIEWSFTQSLHKTEPPIGFKFEGDPGAHPNENWEVFQGRVELTLESEDEKFHIDQTITFKVRQGDDGLWRLVNWINDPPSNCEAPTWGTIKRSLN